MEKKLTIYQRLNKVLGNDVETPEIHINPNSFNVNSSEEFELKTLEAQQVIYLQNQWKKIENELFQKAMYYEPTRIAAFYDYEAMEYMPEISAAIDIFSEEATTSNDKGNILNIYSDSNRIKEELNDLFFEILDIDSSLTSWARNVVKYGDNFVYLKVIPTKGVVGASQLPNIEITRSEPGFTKVMNMDDFNKENNIKFYWKEKDLSFNSFEIAHFRLLGDDRRLPYGTSVLEKVRRIWKQIVLAEDAMLVYRVTRAPERRIYKVYVGNMDDKDIDAYVEKVANNFKRTNMVNSSNGNQDTRYNSLAVDQDLFIPTRDPQLPNPIDTLPGAQNLDAISDIEHLQKKMLAALRIPKAFIGFEESLGDGKNLAILDIRFSRAVHKIQKALVRELNKIAIIHLYMKGYEDDLTNFTLTLNNPSTQAEMLKVQNLREKLNLFRDATSPIEDSIAPMSMTLAKKEILNMSDDEIKLDMQRQLIERAAKEELKLLSEVIKQTGIFEDIYKIYGIDPENLDVSDDGENKDSGGGSSFGGGGGVGTDFTQSIDNDETSGDENVNPDEGTNDLEGEDVVNIDNLGDEQKISEASIKKNIKNKTKLFEDNLKKLNNNLDNIIKEG